MERDQQLSYQHLLSSDYQHSTFFSTSPLLTEWIETPKQTEVIKSNDTNKSAQAHTTHRQPEAADVEDNSQGSQDENDWSQWFDDEFASIYRQYQQNQQTEDQQDHKNQQKSTKNSLRTSQSMSTKISHAPKPLHAHRQKQTGRSCVSATTTNITNDICSLPDQASVADRPNRQSPPPQPQQHRPQIQQVLQPFPWPQSVEQIYVWCRIAKRSQDANSQIKLCRRLLVTLAHHTAKLKQEQVTKSNLDQHSSSHNLSHASMIQPSSLSLPSLFSTGTSTSTCTSSSSSSSILVQTPPPPPPPLPAGYHDQIHHVMTRECLGILKRQSNGQRVGKGGNSEAQYVLANCYGIGLLGLTEDHSKAFKLYMQASKQAHPEATYRTAVCYELGIGTRKDGQRAMIFYRKAARLSHAGGMYKLGMILLRGDYHTTPMPREAISWLQRAVGHITSTSTTHSKLPSLYDSNQNHHHRQYTSSIARATSQVYYHQAPHALHALAVLQMSKDVENTTSLIADPAYAIELLHQAAKRDHVPSQLQLGRCFEHGQWGVPVDEALSIYWYTRAAQLDSPEACLAISGWYLTGTAAAATDKNNKKKEDRILPPSDREAYLWARRAITLSAAAAHPADQGTMAKAHFTVAVLLERGVDNLESSKKVRSWMQKAAVLGHQGASHWLEENKEELHA